jgi:uncharacterized protein (DUF2342 family)
MAELTAVSSEIRIELARGSGPKESAYRTSATSPEDALRAVAGVTTVGWQPRERELIVTFDRAACDAEEMIRRCVTALYQNNARISAVNKGRGLEQRVMELTTE